MRCLHILTALCAVLAISATYLNSPVRLIYHGPSMLELKFGDLVILIFSALNEVNTLFRDLENCGKIAI